MGKYVLMRDIKLNDDVEITLPAHVWLGFVVAYSDTSWRSSCALAVADAVQEALLDQRELKERQAALQRQQDQEQQIASRFLGNEQPPDEVPPDASGL